MLPFGSWNLKKCFVTQSRSRSFDELDVCKVLLSIVGLSTCLFCIVTDILNIRMTSKCELAMVQGHWKSGLILRKILDCTGGDIYGERGARGYNGGMGAEPSGVQGQIPWSGGQGAKLPWSWQHFSVWTLEERGKFASLSVFCNVSTLHHRNCTMMSSTLCFWSFWTAQFLILDCTNCILDCTNWLDCTLRISPAENSAHQ